jgi:hypothetical protein
MRRSHGQLNRAEQVGPQFVEVDLIRAGPANVSTVRAAP